MRAVIELLRLAVRNWLNAPSSAEIAHRSQIEEYLHEMRQANLRS